MQNNIYLETLLRKRIIMKPEYLNKNLDKNIENVLKSEIANKCINEGYVDGDTIKIIKKSLPKVITFNFSGSLAVDIMYSANICNPVRGNIISCKITHINKLGIKAENGPVSVIVAKEYHSNKEIFKNLSVGEMIDVLVINKRYTLNDKVIEIIGKLTTDKDVIKLDKKEKKLKKDGNITERLTEIPNVDLDELKEQSEELSLENEDISDIEKDVIAGESEDEDDEGDLLEQSIEEEITEETDDEDYE